MEKLKECPPDKILNPKTNRCVSKTGIIGKKLLNNKNNNKNPNCPSDKILNPKTNRCVSKTGIIGKKLLNDKNNKKPKLSDLLGNTFIHYPLDHSFDKDAIKNFLNECDPSVKDIAKKIIDNTDHISFEQLLIRINKIIKELIIKINDNNNLYIYISNDLKKYKYKSNYWLYTYISNYIKYLFNIENKKINLILTEDLNTINENNANIILIDDCVYSGLQMSTTIKNIEYKTKKQINFYIIVPYISDKGKNKIKKMFNDNVYLMQNKCILTFFKNTYMIKSINSILTQQELYKIQIFYVNLFTFSNKYLIYFDHKVADIISTITAFYMGIVPCNENFNLHNYYSQEKHEAKIQIPDKYLKKFKIIPIIKNCSHYINNIDLLSPKCPSPPYKKGFYKFIKIIKKNKKKALSI
jgi:hypothetical protein